LYAWIQISEKKRKQQKKQKAQKLSSTSVSSSTNSPPSQQPTTVTAAALAINTRATPVHDRLRSRNAAGIIGRVVRELKKQ
jgi:hypothetical protein